MAKSSPAISNFNGGEVGLHGKAHRMVAMLGGALAQADPAPAAQAEQRLDLAHDFAAGGFGFENLPDEALESQAQAEDALSAVGALLGGGEPMGRESVLKEARQLVGAGGQLGFGRGHVRGV